MKYRITKALFSLILLTFFIRCSQKNNSKVNNSNAKQQVTPVKLDPDQIIEGQIKFKMSHGKDSIGTSEINTTYKGEQLIVNEVTNVTNMYEDMTAYIRKNTFAMDSVIIKGTMQGFPIDSKVVWDDNHVVGTSDFPKHEKVPTHSIDTTLNKGTIERLASFFCFLQAMPLKENFKLNYYQLNTADCKVRNIALNVTGSDNIEVPAGKFETYKVTLNGGVASQNFFVTKTTPRKIVKITFNDSPYIYELL